MASFCPVCKKKLTIADWRQNCPHCGTNLMFHGFEERFFNDAKLAELGFAKVRTWWARVMACYFGGRLQIMRMIFILLPVAALLLPFASLKIELPLYSSSISFNLLGIVNMLSSGSVGLFFTADSSPVTGPLLSAGSVVLISIFGAALCAVLIVLFEILCFIKERLMSALIAAAGLLGIGFSLYGIYAAGLLCRAADEFSQSFTATASFGQYILCLAFVAVIIPNLLLARRGIEIKYKEGDLYRVSVAKKLKRKEIRLEDLPQPIFETDEERQERERAIEDTMHGRSHEKSSKEGME